MKIPRRNFVASLMGTTTLSLLGPAAEARADSGRPSPAALAGDPRRPQYHLLPPANWMNDPNGPIFWKGNYHMFYQYNPHGAVWGDMHWGHAVSSDMVHWKHLPVALAPTPGGADADGCFTGTATVRDGRVVILYTGVRASAMDEATIKDSTPPLRETQCLAIAGDPDLKTWTKAPAPVIAAPPAGMEVNGFRDPSPWRQGDWWYLVAASGIPNQGGAVLLYRSQDLRDWEFMHILAGRDRLGEARFGSFDPWEVWECPEFFALGEWHVLIYSTGGKSWWQSGKLDGAAMQFHPAQAGMVDYGSYYAAKTQLDEAGNRVLWGWVQETRPLEEYKAAGWAGVMSLPRVLTAGQDGRLRFRFASVLEELRGQQQSVKLTASRDDVLREIAALRIDKCCGEILLVAQRPQARFGMAISSIDDRDRAWLTLEYDPVKRNEILMEGRPVPLDLGEEELTVRIYVDGSVIEAVVNDQTAWTKRFYPGGNAAPALGIRWTGDTRPMKRLSCWQLNPISGDRLTT